jgi:hypothetical protein
VPLEHAQLGAAIGRPLQSFPGDVVGQTRFGTAQDRPLLTVYGAGHDGRAPLLPGLPLLPDPPPLVEIPLPPLPLSLPELLPVPEVLLPLPPPLLPEPPPMSPVSIWPPHARTPKSGAAKAKMGPRLRISCLMLHLAQ